MKTSTLTFILFVNLLSIVSGKPYAFPAEHCQINISNEWRETTDSDELISVENDDNDSFTITVNSLGKTKVDIKNSDISRNVKDDYAKKGFEIIQSGPMDFQEQPAFFIVAKKTTLTFTFFLYNILLVQGHDLLSLIMVGDKDPRENPQFKAILDTFSILPLKTTDMSSAASAPTTQ